MLILSIFMLISSSAVTLIRDKYILFARSVIVTLIIGSFIGLSELHIEFLNQNLGLFHSLFHTNAMTHVFHLFVFIVLIFTMLSAGSLLTFKYIFLKVYKKLLCLISKLIGKIANKIVNFLPNLLTAVTISIPARKIGEILLFDSKWLFFLQLSVGLIYIVLIHIIRHSYKNEFNYDKLRKSVFVSSILFNITFFVYTCLLQSNVLTEYNQCSIIVGLTTIYGILKYYTGFYKNLEDIKIPSSILRMHPDDNKTVDQGESSNTSHLTTTDAESKNKEQSDIKNVIDEDTEFIKQTRRERDELRKRFRDIIDKTKKFYSNLDSNIDSSVMKEAYSKVEKELKPIDSEIASLTQKKEEILKNPGPSGVEKLSDVEHLMIEKETKRVKGRSDIYVELAKPSLLSKISRYDGTDKNIATKILNDMFLKNNELNDEWNEFLETNKKLCEKEKIAYPKVTERLKSLHQKESENNSD